MHSISGLNSLQCLVELQNFLLEFRTTGYLSFEEIGLFLRRNLLRLQSPPVVVWVSTMGQIGV